MVDKMYFLVYSVVMINHTLERSEKPLLEPEHKAERTIAEYGNQHIGVAVVDAREKKDDGKLEGRTILWPMSFEARLDEFEMQRFEVLADVLKARVIAVEVPGVGMEEGAKTTLRQKTSLAAGNFKAHARAMLGALAEVVPFKENEEVEMLLFSQGGAEGVAMAKELGKKKDLHGLKLKIPRVTFIEAVNDDGWFLPNLLAKINKDTNQENTDRYLQENEYYSWLVKPSDRDPDTKQEWERLKKCQTVNNLLAGAALQRPFRPKLVRAIKKDKRNGGKTGISRARIDLIRTNASLVAREKSNRKTVEKLRKVLVGPLGQAALINIVPAPGDKDHHHPAVQSKPFVRNVAEQLLR